MVLDLRIYLCTWKLHYIALEIGFSQDFYFSQNTKIEEHIAKVLVHLFEKARLLQK